MEQVGPSMDGAGWCRADGSIAKPSQTIVGLLMNAPARMGSWEASQSLHLPVPISMAYSERAMKLLTKVIEDYPRRTGPHRPLIGHESMH